MKKELSKEDSEMYIKIVQHGTMDDMFDWAYRVAEIACYKKQIAILKEALGK